VCLVGVWQRNFEPVVGVYGTATDDFISREFNNNNNNNNNNNSLSSIITEQLSHMYVS
jgi:hypothetical protein